MGRLASLKEALTLCGCIFTLKVRTARSTAARVYVVDSNNEQDDPRSEAVVVGEQQRNPARSTARVYVVDSNNEQDDPRSEAVVGEQQRNPSPHQKRRVSVANAIHQFSVLAESAFIPEVSYFVTQALTHRTQGHYQTNKQRASFFKAIVEDFFVGGTSLRLNFLSPGCLCEVMNHYLQLPFELTPPLLPLSENAYSSSSCEDLYLYEVTAEHSIPEVFDTAIIEALEHACTIFSQRGLPTDCLFFLKQQVVLLPC